MMAPRRNPLLGVARLARGRPEGMAQFGDTPQAFLSSLAPLIALSLVGSALMTQRFEPVIALTLFLMALILQLGQHVVSHAIAVRWNREEDWLRYAVATNWCQLLAPVVGIVMLFGVQIVVGLGAPAMGAIKAGFVMLAVYLVWLQWLVARHGLDLSRGRAAGMVALVTTVTYAMVTVPSLLAALMENGSDG